MNIYQLKYFQVVAREENISRAAEKLNLSQQALSSVMATLERKLDVKLFDRVGRKIVLNEDGKLVLKSVDLIVQEYDEMMWKLGQKKDLKRRTLKIGSTSTQAIRKILMSFLQDNQDIQVTNFYINADMLTEVIRRKDVDLVISTRPYEDEQTRCRLLFEERIYLVVSVKHPLAAREAVYLSEAKDCVFTLPLPNNAFRITVQEMCEKAGFQPYIILETDNEEQLALSVSRNMAILPIPEVSTDLPYYSNELVTKVPLLDDYAKRQIYLIWREKKQESESWKRFYEYVFREGEKGILENKSKKG